MLYKLVDTLTML